MPFKGGNVAPGALTADIRFPRVDGKRAAAALIGNGDHLTAIAREHAGRSAVGAGESGAHDAAGEEANTVPYLTVRRQPALSNRDDRLHGNLRQQPFLVFQMEGL